MVRYPTGGVDIPVSLAGRPLDPAQHELGPAKFDKSAYSIGTLYNGTPSMPNHGPEQSKNNLGRLSNHL
jgi:hypothetical protein